MNEPKIYADKYLKDGVDVEEFTKAFCDVEGFGYQTIMPNCIREFLNKQIKPTLTEDEKVILRKLPEKYMYIGRRDGTPSIELYIKSDDDFKHCWCFYNDLFQFIQPRRRI